VVFFTLKYKKDPTYVSDLAIYHPLLEGNSDMADKGSYLYHMEHSKTVAYDANGLLYDQAYTQLKLTLGYAAYAFPAHNFFMCIDVNPLSNPAMNGQVQLIFSKKRSDGSDYIDIWIVRDAADAKIRVRTAGNIEEQNSFFTYDTWTRVGIFGQSANYRLYKNNINIVNLNTPAADTAGYVIFHDEN